MRKIETRTLVLAAVMLIVITLLTCLPRISMGIERTRTTAGADGQTVSTTADSGLFMSLGDSGILVAASLLGSPFGILVAALASALSNLFVGSYIYILPALLAKGAMAYLAGLLLKKHQFEWAALTKLVLWCSLLSIFAYFLFDLVIMGSYVVAALALPYNLLQAIVNGLIALPVLKATSGLSYYYQAGNKYNYSLPRNFRVK